MGPRDGLDECGKSRHQPGFDPRTVQSVASRNFQCMPKLLNFICIHSVGFTAWDTHSVGWAYIVC